MRFVFNQRIPPGTRILLIESGSRSILEPIVAHLRAGWGEGMPIDLVTCYAGLPAGLDKTSRVFHVADYPTPELRRALVRELRNTDYAYAGMICAADPVMNKWKWWLAAQVRAKVFVINENGDYFWLNRKNIKAIRGFALYRLGLSGAGALRTFGRLLAFPFAVLYLLLYAGMAHLRRFIRVKIFQS